MAWQGYMVGTVLYFAIVYSLPISMGLAAVALDLPVSQHVEFMCQLPCCALFQAAGRLPAPHCCLCSPPAKTAVQNVDA